MRLQALRIFLISNKHIDKQRETFRKFDVFPFIVVIFCLGCVCFLKLIDLLEDIDMVFPARVSELDNVLSWVETALEEGEVPLKVSMPFLVAVEEIFVNVASYAYKDGEGDVDIELTVADNEAKICFTDTGIEFNPLTRPDPDVKASAEDRPIGGLGIYMVKKSMDGVDYDRQNDKNVMKFWKNF